MKKTIMTASALALACFTTIISSQDNSMSFFITSVGSGDGANLGGLEGADAHCAALATAVGAGGKTWRAYLSTQGAGCVNARDRIGTGPWYNARGVMIAENVAQLHSEEAMTGKENSLTEAGNMVNGRGDTPNQHDILTGSQADGTAFSGDTNLTCNNWTSNSAGSAQAGHNDRQGGGANPTSWNSAHGTRSCSQEDLIATGGNGYFYCFAID